MRERHPGLASGRGGCFSRFFLLSRAVVLVVSAVLAHGDCHDFAVAGADGPRIRVVGEGDARGPQLVDQARCHTRSSDLHGAVGWRLIAAVEDGEGGQVWQDLDPPGRRCSSAGPGRCRWRWCGRNGTGRRACRWTMLIPAAARTDRRRAARPAGTAVWPGLPGRAARWCPGRR